MKSGGAIVPLPQVGSDHGKYQEDRNSNANPVSSTATTTTVPRSSESGGIVGIQQ